MVGSRRLDNKAGVPATESVALVVGVANKKRSDNVVDVALGHVENQAIIAQVHGCLQFAGLCWFAISWLSWLSWLSGAWLVKFWLWGLLR